MTKLSSIVLLFSILMAGCAGTGYQSADYLMDPGQAVDEETAWKRLSILLKEDSDLWCRSLDSFNRTIGGHPVDDLVVFTESYGDDHYGLLVQKKGAINARYYCYHKSRDNTDWIEAANLLASIGVQVP